MDGKQNGVAKELLGIEHRLARGDGETYERHLHETALVVIPGNTLDKSDAVRAVEASPGWDEVSIGAESVRELGDGAALLTYLFRGRRGESHYQARLSSAYVRDEGEWKLAFHQHTPDPEAA